MNNKINIRRWIILSVLFISTAVGKLSAQTFYEITYTDKKGYQNYGLMLYYDEENCTLLLRRHKADGSKFTFNTFDYVSIDNSNENDEDSNYLVMACEQDNTPVFVWLWDKEESPEQQLIPYVVMDSDLEKSVDSWIRANSFCEVKLSELTAEYTAQYLDPNSEISRQIAAAHLQAVNNERDQRRIIEALGDGSAIARTISSEVAAARSYIETNGANTDKTSGSIELNTANNGDMPVMHLLVVANTEVADIGAACRVDYYNIHNEMKGVAQSLGIQLRQYNVTGELYSKESLKEQLNKLNPKPNDIVMFLYTGHGFRFSNQSDPFPMMAMTTNDYQELEGNYVALSDVYDVICQKGARLNIVLSDCCNSDAGERRPLQGNTLFSRGNNNFSRERLAELFLRTKGSVLSTAASPGEYSWCDVSGGMFTLSFIQSLRREISAMNSDDVNWQSVVDNTLKNALQRSKNSAEAQNGIKKMAITKL